MKAHFYSIAAVVLCLGLGACPQQPGIDGAGGAGGAPAVPPVDDGAAQLGTPGGIKIVVGLEGLATVPKPLDRKADPLCAKSEKIDPSVLIHQGKLQNVLVRLAGEVSTEQPAPATPVEINETECMFEPRVIAARAGQKLKIANQDETMYMVQAYRGEERKSWFNEAQPPGAPPIEKILEPGMVQLKCGSHAWMAAFVSVADHPFNSVTGEDGTVSWDMVPSAAEPYKVETWHEVFGKQELEVLVEPGKVAEVIVTYKAKVAK